jgi:hypothetical protein
VHLLAAAQHARSASIFARYHDADNIFWKIYGSTGIRSAIEKNVNPSSIIAGWKSGVEKFRAARASYLLY